MARSLQQRKVSIQQAFELFDNDGDGYDSAGDSTDADGNALPRFNAVTGMAYGSYSGGGRIFVETFGILR